MVCRFVDNFVASTRLYGGLSSEATNLVQMMDKAAFSDQPFAFSLASKNVDGEHGRDRV